MVFTTALYYPETTATFVFRQSIDIHAFTKRFIKGPVLACNMPCLTVQYAVFCNAIRRLLECVSSEGIKSLNNEGLRYDNITLIRQSENMAGSDYRLAYGEE